MDLVKINKFEDSEEYQETYNGKVIKLLQQIAENTKRV